MKLNGSITAFAEDMIVAYVITTNENIFSEIVDDVLVLSKWFDCNDLLLSKKN